MCADTRNVKDTLRCAKLQDQLSDHFSKEAVFWWNKAKDTRFNNGRDAYLEMVKEDRASANECAARAGFYQGKAYAEAMGEVR